MLKDEEEETARMNSSRSGVAIRIIAWCFFAVAVVFAAVVGMIIKEGGRWTASIAGISISAGNAQWRIYCVIASLLIWQILMKRIWRDRRGWLKLFGQVALLSISCYVSIAIGERIVRRSLRAQQSQGSIQDLERLNQGEDVDVKSTHPLAAITRVSANKKIVYELKPNLTMDFGHTRLKINSDCLRDDYEYKKGRQPGVTRIVGIGDSGMFGWSCHQEQSYMSVLEENLAAHYGQGKYDVLNLAVPGYNTFQEVEMLKYKGLPYHPDIVVVGWCMNDLAPPFLLQKRREYNEPDVSYLYFLLFDRERLNELTKPIVMSVGEIDKKLVDPELLASSGEQGVIRALEELKKLGDENGFKSIVFGPLGDKIVKICEKAGLDYFDTFTIPAEEHPPQEVRGATLYGIHPRPNAHRFLAERLEKHIVERGWIPAMNPAAVSSDLKAGANGRASAR